jgi:hypothetical protein
MTHNIIKTENYLLVVDDSKIKQNDWFYLNDANIIAEYISVKPVNEAKKITAHLPLNNSPILEGVPLLPPLEDGVEEIVKDYVQELIDCKSVKEHERAWISAICHQLIIKAKDKYKYTEEEYNKLLSFIKKIDDEGYDPYDSAHHLQVSRYVDEVRNIIQSLLQPKMPVAFECEEIYCGYMEDEALMKPKTTTNPQGQTVLVGKYIY